MPTSDCRCWVTGINLRSVDAFQLDRHAAAAMRRELVQTLALLDQVMEELGPAAGTGPRALQLASKPGSPRLVCRLVAQGYGIGLRNDELFKTRAEIRASSMRYWYSRIEEDPVLSRILPQEQAERVRLYRISGRILAGMDKVAMREARKLHYDVKLAFAFGAGPFSQLEDWLATQDVFSLCTSAGIPTVGNVDVLQGIESRCELARQRIAERNQPDVGDIMDLDEDPVVPPGDEEPSDGPLSQEDIAGAVT